MKRDFDAAKTRCYQLVIAVIALTLAMQGVVVGLYHVKNHTLAKAVRHYQQDHPLNQTRIETIQRWKNAVLAQEQHKKSHGENEILIHTFEQRLDELQYVKLRLLRIRPSFLYCIIDSVSEKSVEKYAQYLLGKQYRLTQQHQLDNAWYLEFSIDGHP